VIAAGSHRRDVIGDAEEDWLAMPTMAAREPSSAVAQGREHSERPAGAEG
jgi:hypothetical protein